MEPAEALGRYPVSVTIPVAWGEMDAFQHVNNVAFARWIETARVAYFGRLGLMRPRAGDGVGPILARIAIDYGRPVSYPDTVHVDATVRKIGRSSLTMGYRIWSEEQRAEVATGEAGKGLTSANFTGGPGQVEFLYQPVLVRRGRAGESEAGLGVIEHRPIPVDRGVAKRAVRGESCRNVVGVGGRLVVGFVAGEAVHSIRNVLAVV